MVSTTRGKLSEIGGETDAGHSRGNTTETFYCFSFSVQNWGIKKNRYFCQCQIISETMQESLKDLKDSIFLKQTDHFSSKLCIAKICVT